MPSPEDLYPIIIEQPQQDHTQGQAIKLCLFCRCPLESPNSLLYGLDDHDSSSVCASCRDRASCIAPEDNISLLLAVGNGLSRPVPSNIVTQPNGLQQAHIIHDSPFEEDTDVESSPSSSFPSDSSVSSFSSPCSCPPISATAKHPPLAIRTTPNISSWSTFPHHHTPSTVNTAHRSQRQSIPPPDPLVDITRIRVRPQGHHCLYPGATFQGSQKSGRNSYEVNVSIVDVDFSSSFLCGYLRIRGLTDDYPELTTYFDAEIIGSRYGFLTENWGANKQEDMVHWQRFPAFRHVKNELKEPHLTIPDRERGAVFMRWKERFLVPDHRVQDINGASFAGFYYVCVDFNPPPPASTLRSVTQSVPLGSDISEDVPLSMSPPSVKQEMSPPVRRRRDSSVRRGARGTSVGPRAPLPPATMSGFYFHQNSEPYQQLSLSHVPERFSSSFEFR